MFTDDDALAAELSAAGAAENDPLWRMPLWQPYAGLLDSKVADTNNVSTGGQGGAITAALFLRKFVAAKSWLHLDIFAWNATASPAVRKRRTADGTRALFNADEALQRMSHQVIEPIADLRREPRTRRRSIRRRCLASA